MLFCLWDFFICKVAVTFGKFYRHFRVIFERHCGCGLERCTVKTLKIGTPRLTTVVVVNIKQFDFTMQ